MATEFKVGDIVEVTLYDKNWFLGRPETDDEIMEVRLGRIAELGNVQLYGRYPFGPGARVHFGNEHVDVPLRHLKHIAPVPATTCRMCGEPTTDPAATMLVNGTVMPLCEDCSGWGYLRCAEDNVSWSRQRREERLQGARNVIETNRQAKFWREREQRLAASAAEDA